MKNKLLEIINHYGVGNQQKKLAEEVFELQEAIITKRNRDKFNPFVGFVELGNKLTGNKDQYVEHIKEEIADVFVILGQFIEYYKIDTKEINNTMNYKINRQLERINKE